MADRARRLRLRRSAAGHSYDRIDRLFTELNERESEVADSPGASLVAAVGDDEQFAAAVALIAADLGFPSRVVLGARLETPTRSDGPFRRASTASAKARTWPSGRRCKPRTGCGCRSMSRPSTRARPRRT